MRRVVAIARRLGFLALLGAASTVAVAWACGAWINFGRSPLRKMTAAVGPFLFEYDGKYGFGAERHRVFVTHEGESAASTAAASVLDLTELSKTPGAESPTSGYSLLNRWPPPWGALYQRPVRERTISDWPGYVEDARGWPWLALHAEMTDMWPISREGPSAWRGGIGLPNYDTWPDEIDMPRELPYLPIWRGFLGDTAFYAAVWGALLSAPRFVLGRMRWRRGQCPRCAYDLSGLRAPICPECGWKQSGAGAGSAAATT